MQPHDPSIPEHSTPIDGGRALPTLELPPAPFARPATSQSIPASASEPMPSGTSVADLLGALTSADPMVEAAPTSAPAQPQRPLHEFSVAVDRRARRERRREQRSTPERRTFTSEHLAAPASGPADPRPTQPPAHELHERANPIDPVMPPLPLEPAVSYELPNRGVSAQAVRSTRASLALTELPFPANAIEHPPAPHAAPEPPTSAPVGPTAADLVPVAAPAAQVQPGPVGIESIFEQTAQQTIGQLASHPAPPADLRIPDAGPAGPASAPGANLAPVAAAVATAPAAWYGGAVQVDDAMMIWNAPGTDAPLAPSVASLISPAPPVASAAASPAASAATAAASPVATTPLSPAAAAPGTAGRSPLRLLLLVGVPASAGVGLAFAIERFLL